MGHSLKTTSGRPQSAVSRACGFGFKPRDLFRARFSKGFRALNPKPSADTEPYASPGLSECERRNPRLESSCKKGLSTRQVARLHARAQELLRKPGPIPGAWDCSRKPSPAPRKSKPVRGWGGGAGLLTSCCDYGIVDGKLYG